VKTDLVKY